MDRYSQSNVPDAYNAYLYGNYEDGDEFIRDFFA